MVGKVVTETMRKFICDFCGKETEPSGYIDFSKVNPNDSGKGRELYFLEYCAECEPTAKDRIREALKSFGMTMPGQPFPTH